jgi:hypothetical protein
MAEKIRLIFTTERPLNWLFRPKKEKIKCPLNCIACRTAEKAGNCFSKYVIYKIRCLVCHAVYVGQTERTVRTRITEHTKAMNSHVFIHMATHGANQALSFKWKILGSHKDNNTRLAMEALFIRQETEVMNGCEGVFILPTLL